MNCFPAYRQVHPSHHPMRFHFPPLPLYLFSTLAVDLPMHSGQTRMPLQFLQKTFVPVCVNPSSINAPLSKSLIPLQRSTSTCLVVLQPPNGNKFIYASTTLRFSTRDRTIRSRQFSPRRSFEFAPPRIRANQPCCLDFRNPSLFAHKLIEFLPQCINIWCRCILDRSDRKQHGKLGGLHPAVHARPDGRRLLQPRVQPPDHVPRCAANSFLLFSCCATCFYVRRFAGCLTIYDFG
jgi:hypothetical protein